MVVSAGESDVGSTASVGRDVFGVLPDGRPVEAVTLANGGVSATVLSFGATLQSVHVPDHDGKRDDVILGYDDLAGYLADASFLGITAGRFANRIAGGRFALDGQSCVLARNDGANTLHGGPAGFGKQVWEVVEVAADADAGATLRLVSPDGDQGFPGTLTVTARFAIDARGTLSIRYRATSDRPTVVSLTSHAYWNLAGAASGAGARCARLTIHADRFMPVGDADMIPSGERRAVAGTLFDFRRPRVIGERMRFGEDEQLRLGGGYDHNWLIADAASDRPRAMARLEDPRSGRVLELASNQPGLQFYSGNRLDGSIAGKRGRRYRAGDGVCLEPQLPPDTPNQPDFGSARLLPGDTYDHRLTFAFPRPPGR